MAIFGSGQNLKSVTTQNKIFENINTGNVEYPVKTFKYTKMSTRTIFNVTFQANGINKYFSSKNSPNIFDITISVQGSGLTKATWTSVVGPGGTAGEENVAGSLQYNEYYQPLKDDIADNLINNIFNPENILLINKTRTEDVSGETISINSTAGLVKYKMGSISESISYRVYFPRVNRHVYNHVGSHSWRNEDVIGCNVSCQDKVYNLAVTTMYTA